jgi:16S rRNA (adenine1518-N6/adenine1519-N6)-dimethyltransferase
MSEPPAPDLPSQPSLRRMRAFAVRPKRDLGQNFLIDSNILGVIERAAELGPDDVVLEVGGGLGVLSEYLAERAAHTHVVEVDRSLEPALRDALAPYEAKATLHLGDALDLDLPALDPAPTKVVANLPYGIAATAILDTVFELPSVTRWVAMVQKEVGERFAAQPGTSAYGVPSVLAQLACDVKVHRSVARTVFHPVPNVDSVLVVLERTGAPPPPALRALVQGAFAHRRKALARSLEISAKDPRWRDSAPKSLQLHTGDKGVRDRARAALAELGLPEDARAERLTPAEFRALGEKVGAAGGAAA